MNLKQNVFRDGLYWAAELCWATVFQVLGRISRPVVAQFVAGGGQRILVIAPHPDDETIGCGGTVILHRQGGDLVFLSVVTDGRRSRALDFQTDEMVERRRQEVAAAADILGLEEVDWCGLPEGNWETADAHDRLLSNLIRVRPDVVYAPSRIDFHPEHVRVAHAAALALKTYGQTLTVRVYPIQVPLTTRLSNLVVDTSPVAPVVEAALKAYKTQQGSLAGALRQRRYTARYYGYPYSGEVFWQMPVESYIWLHEETPETWTDEFRGLRPGPLSDPLAYLTGSRQRRIYRALPDTVVIGH
jgi:LmbE family N-acetylglucosaminyl deacetylase